MPRSALLPTLGLPVPLVLALTLTLAGGTASAQAVRATVQSATDMRVSVGGVALAPGQAEIVGAPVLAAMTNGKRRQFCLDPRAHTTVGQNIVIERQGPDGCSWSIEMPEYRGYAQWTAEKDAYAFAGAQVSQAQAGSGQATVPAPAGASSWTVTVTGETLWTYFRRTPGGEVKNQETEKGSATIRFDVVAGPPVPPTPAAQPPRDPSYPVDGHKLCEEALSFFGLARQPGQTHIRRDFDGIYADLVEGVDRYTRDNPGAKLTTSIPNNRAATLAALNWLFAEGGSAANLNLPGGQALSRSFIFTNPADTGFVFQNLGRIEDGKVQAPPGTESALLAGIAAKFRRDGGRKLDPGDVMALALAQTKGDVRQASLLAHNTLRSLSRGADGNYTGINSRASFFTTYLQTIRGDALRAPPPGPDDKAGDYGGPWYHLFGTMFFELQVRGAQVANGAPPLLTGMDVGSGPMGIGTARWFMDLINGSDPFAQTLDSEAANRLEQYYREYGGGRTPDPEKYCFNIWGAKLGAWLWSLSGTTLGPCGAATCPPSTTRPPAAQPPPPSAQPRPPAPAPSPPKPDGLPPTSPASGARALW